MLNEIQEYKDLTQKDNCNTENVRPVLRYRVLYPDLSGIERAMTIVTRGFAFPSNFENGTEEIKDIKCIRNYLKSWCGLKNNPKYYKLKSSKNNKWQWKQMSLDEIEKLDEVDKKRYKINKNCLEEEFSVEFPEEFFVESSNENKEQIKTQVWGAFQEQFPEVCFLNESSDTCNNCCEEIKSVDNWLGNYIESFSAPQSTDKKNTEYLKKKLKDKKSQFSQHIFNTSLNSEEGEKTKAITYEKIIANALNAGPLNEYVLYVNKNITDITKLFENIRDRRKNKKDENGKVGSDKLNQASYSVILAAVTYYLIQRKNEQKFVVFNKADYQNFLYGNLPKNGGLSCFKYYNGDSKEPLFEERVFDGNTIKLCVNENWLKKTELKVMNKKAFYESGIDETKITRINYKYEKNEKNTGNGYDLKFYIEGDNNGDK